MKKIFWKKLFMIVFIILLIFAIVAGAFMGFLAFRPVSEPVFEDINHSSNIDIGSTPYEIKVYTSKQRDILAAYEKAVSMTKEELEGYTGISIILTQDEYVLNSTLNFDKKAVSGLPVEITSDASSTVSGGYSFSGGWKEFRDGIYVRELSGYDFRQLYVNGDLATRSRFPNENEHYEKECLTGKWLDDTKEYSIPGDFSPYLKNYNAADLEIHAIEAWTHSIMKTNSLRKGGNNNVFKLTAQNEKQFFEKRSTKIAEPKTWIENSLELVDAKNEWYYDKANGKLYYIPEDASEINNLTFTVPVVEQLLKVTDSSDIKISSIKFRYSNWTYPNENGFVDGQGTNSMMIVDGKIYWDKPPAAVEIANSDNIEISNCQIASTGATALKYDPSCDDIFIGYNDIYDIGAGGIIAGSFSETPLEDPISNNVTISDNVIERIGRSYLGGVGIIVGYAKHLAIDHNEISDGGYTGISVGWGWGAQSEMTDYKIRYNKVTNIINNYLYDGAGLYTLGKFSGDGTNQIIGNVLEGGNGYAGLYFDEMSNNYIAKYNVIGKGREWFLLMHDINYGLKNITVTDNFIATTKKHINSYPNVNAQVVSEEISPEDRNIVIKDNWTKFNVNWQKNVDLITRNAGARK